MTENKPKRETDAGGHPLGAEKPGMGGLVRVPLSRSPRPRAYGVARKTADTIMLIEIAVEKGGSTLWTRYESAK